MIRETHYAVRGLKEVLHGEERIQAALNQLSGVQEVNVDVDKGRVRVRHLPDITGAGIIGQALELAGFPASEISLPSGRH